MNIETLGIKPLIAHMIPSTQYGMISSFELEDVRKLEQQRNDLLEALIEMVIDVGHDIPEALILHTEEVSIIEKATGKSWEEIKELYK